MSVDELSNPPCPSSYSVFGWQAGSQSTRQGLNQLTKGSFPMGKCCEMQDVLKEIPSWVVARPLLCLSGSVVFQDFISSEDVVAKSFCTITVGTLVNLSGWVALLSTGVVAAQTTDGMWLVLWEQGLEKEDHYRLRSLTKSKSGRDARGGYAGRDAGSEGCNTPGFRNMTDHDLLIPNCENLLRSLGAGYFRHASWMRFVTMKSSTVLLSMPSVDKGETTGRLRFGDLVYQVGPPIIERFTTRFQSGRIGSYGHAFSHTRSPYAHSTPHHRQHLPNSFPSPLKDQIVWIPVAAMLPKSRSPCPSSYSVLPGNENRAAFSEALQPTIGWIQDAVSVLFPLSDPRQIVISGEAQASLDVAGIGDGSTGFSLRIGRFVSEGVSGKEKNVKDSVSVELQGPPVVVQMGDMSVVRVPLSCGLWVSAGTFDTRRFIYSSSCVTGWTKDRSVWAAEIRSVTICSLMPLLTFGTKSRECPTNVVVPGGFDVSAVRLEGWTSEGPTATMWASFRITALRFIPSFPVISRCHLGTRLFVAVTQVDVITGNYWRFCKLSIPSPSSAARGIPGSNFIHGIAGRSSTRRNPAARK